MKRFNKGFTLSELLIVVAIIAVLVAIAIPVFTSQLEKSREATDLANVRAAYAEVMVMANSGDETSTDTVTYSNNSWSVSVALKQQQNGWQMSLPITIGGVESESSTDGAAPDPSQWIGKPVRNGICTVSYSELGGIRFIWNGDRAVANVLFGVVDGKTDRYARLCTLKNVDTMQIDVFGATVKQREPLGDGVFQVLCAQDINGWSALSTDITNSLINKKPTVNGQPINWETTKVNYITMKLGPNGSEGDVLGYQLIQTNADGTYNAYTCDTNGIMTVEMNKTEAELKASPTAYKGN